MTLPELPALPNQPRAYRIDGCIYVDSETFIEFDNARKTRESILVAEIERLRAECEALRSELHNIANADTSTWGDEMRDQFKLWAQNRARAAIDAAREAKP